MPTPIDQLKREAIMAHWGDPTDCFTEAEEAAMEEARKADLEHSWQLMMDEAFEALAAEHPSSKPSDATWKTGRSAENAEGEGSSPSGLEAVFGMEG